MATLTLFEKLDQIESRYQDLTTQLSSPEVLGDSPRYQKLARTHADLSAVVEKYRQWKELEKGLRETKQMLVESEDAEMKQLAHEEEHQLLERKEIVERELKRLLLPKDPNDEKNVILEIRAGTGGDEAALFAAELSHVLPIRGITTMARRGVGKLALLARRREGYCCGDPRRQSLFQDEV